MKFSAEDKDSVLIEAEEKGFDYFINQVKLIVFQVLYVLRPDDEQSGESMISFYIQTGLDYFQMHTFPFNNKIYYLWKSDEFLSIMLNLVNLFQLSTYIPNITYFTLLVSVYVLLGIIMLIILDIIYVSYSFSTNRFRMLWPLVVLRSVTSLVVTVLFLPITETLTSILQCWVDPTTNQYVIQGYDEIYVECWKDWHIFHALLTLIFIIIFVGICAIVAYAFFEPGMTSNDKTARQDSKGEVAFIINKVTNQLIYCFLDAQQAWILVLVTFLLSVWLFKEYNFEDPYYDYEVGKFYSIISTYYLYANVMLLLCKLFENSDFNGGLIAWVIGLPFLVSIMLMTKKSKIETLVKSQSKFRNGQQLWNHIRYVLQLIQQQETDKNSYMLLVGYIEKHKETCDDKDCYFKNRKRNETDLKDMVRGLLQEIDKMFKRGLQKFPRSSELRVFYALFLIERKKSKIKALEQFELVSLGKPALYLQFITYRYKKIIKDSQGQQDEEKNQDIVNAIAFRNHLIQCEEMINLSANLHKEFWIELKEDQPDLGRLMNIGARITKATLQAKESYLKMQKINADVYQTIKVFGGFILNVLNDTVQGQDLLAQARVIKEKQKRSGSVRIENYDIESQPIPYLAISAKKIDPGIVVTMNTLFTTFFGYQKEELIGKKINILMPQVYADEHDKYLIDCFENLVLNLRMDMQIESNYLDTEQFQYFKHKNGYILPMYYKVSVNLDSYRYFSIFRSENFMKTSIVFIINSSSQILEMTSSAIIYFDLEIKQIRDKKILLTTYLPDLFKNLVNPAIQTTKDIQSHTYQLRDNNDNIHSFTCMVYQIQLPNKNVNDSQDKDQARAPSIQTGVYIVRMEKFEGDNPNKKNSSRSTQAIQVPSSHSSSSKLKLNVASSIESQVPNKFEPNLEIDQQFAAFLTDLYTEPRYEDYKQLLSHQGDCETTPAQDYADNINTRRLINNQIIGIDEEAEAYNLLVLEEEEAENSLFRQGQNQFDDEDDYRIFYDNNSNELIRKVLSSNHKHEKISFFMIYSILWICFIIGITILQYYFCYQYFTQYKSSVRSIFQLNSVLIDFDQLLARVLDLCYEQQRNITEVYDDLTSTIKQINQFNQEINVYSSGDQYYTYMISLRLYDQYDSYRMVNTSLETAIIFITGQALNTTIQDDVTFKFESNIIQNIIYNGVNEVQIALAAISQQLYESVSYEMDQSDFNLLITLGVLIVSSVLAMTKFIFLMLDIKVDRENILFLFLDIPQVNVQELFKKVDKYLKNYVSIQELRAKNELEGYDSSDNEEDKQIEIPKTEKEIDESDIQMQQQLNRKKIIHKYRKNKLKGNQGIIAQFILIALCTLVFAIYNIISSANERSYIKFLLPQFYYTTFNVNLDGQYINNYKLMELQPTYIIQNQTMYEWVLSNFDIFKGKQLESQSFALSLIQNNEPLLNDYMVCFYGDICQYTQSDESCQEIVNGHLTLGIYNTEMFYLEYFRKRLVDLDVTNLTNTRTNELLYEIDHSLYKYIKAGVIKLINDELNLIIDRMDSTLNVSLILVILFICFLLVVFVIVWLPYLQGLNNQINQNIQMLNMIPLDVIRKKQSKTIRRFIKHLIKTMDTGKN